MILGIGLGLLVLASVFLYIIDEDRNATILFVIIIFTIVIAAAIICKKAPKQFEIKQQIKPSIKVVTENGKSDTTYIYKFEEEK